MAANTAPIYSRLGDVSTNGTTGMSQLVTAASTDYTGIDTDAVLVWTADATNGGYIERLRFKAGGTNVATVARIFLNNGATVATATNNAFYGEITLAATTASNVAATAEVDYLFGPAVSPMSGLALPAGFRVYVGYATATAAGWVCVAIGGKY